MLSMPGFFPEIVWSFGILFVSSSFAQGPETEWIDCYPGVEVVSQTKCEERGCVYLKPSRESKAPVCHFKQGEQIYRYSKENGPAGTNGWAVADQNLQKVKLELNRNVSFSGTSPWKDIVVEFERYSTRVMGFRVSFPRVYINGQ